MRYLVEVMLVLEDKQPWARALRDRRKNSEQGAVSLPLPAVSFCKARRAMRSYSVDDVLLCGLMRCLCEGVDKEIMRMIVYHSSEVVSRSALVVVVTHFS